MSVAWNTRILLGAIVALSWGCTSLQAFTVPPRAIAKIARAPLSVVDTTALHAEEPSSGGAGPLSFLFNPYESKIPKEIEKEIYDAEGNTPAAQDRGKRIALYAAIAFVGILMAFFNGFITELRSTPMPDGSEFSLEEAGFGWVESSFVTRFFFMNKIGGGIALLTGGGAAVLAEAEYDTRRINAERIYEELVRRRTAKSEKEAPRKKKQRSSTKEKKRLAALSEVLDSTSSDTAPAAKESRAQSPPVDTTETESESSDTTKEKGGIFGKVKNFYERADSMAASQALLLNKKLEDAGVLEKITDESGLKVVGRQSTKDTESSKDKSSKPKE
eukprot:scaffold43499_cov183-Amphora_coffeaeformis.AAC.1